MKIRILTTVSYYLPGYKSGGPVRSLSNMISHFGDAFKFYILTNDRDAFDTTPYKGIFQNKWNKVFDTFVYYLSPSKCRILKIAIILRKTKYDYLYLNSFFNISFTFLPLVLMKLRLVPRKPIILAPRGEFTLGHLSLKRKYRFYIKFVKALKLYHKIVWQASSEDEKMDIERELGTVPYRIHVAPNLTSTLNDLLFNLNINNENDHLHIVFLSRITPIKNLDYALQILNKVQIPVKFTIIGLLENYEYWDKCRQIITNLPTHISVNYLGVIPHAEVTSHLLQADLFFHPTRGENFGHAIFEALSCGVPALISNTTPWSNIEKMGAGWIRSLDDEEGFVDVIESFSLLSPSERAEIKRKSFKYARDYSENSEFLQMNKSLFLKFSTK